jgi:hypothetical protein
MDCCKFFQQIEADPEAIITDLTIGEYLMARNHLIDCEECNAIVDRVINKYPEERNRIGFNPN